MSDPSTTSLTLRSVLRPRELASHFRTNRVVRNNVIYLAGSILAGVLGYVFHFETGHLLGPSAYAVVASAIAALYILTLPLLGLQFVSARYASLAAATDQLHSVVPILLRITAFSLLGGIPAALGLMFFSLELASFLNLPDNRVVYVLALAGLAALVVTLNRGALQGLRRFVALSVNVFVDMTVRLVTAAALIVAGLGAFGAVAALIFGPVVAYVQSFFMLRQPASGATARVRIEGLGSYAVLATLASVGTNYLFSIDTLLAKHYLDSHTAGLYAAAAVLARAVYFLGLSVAAVMFPEVATLHARNESHFHVVDLSLAIIAGMGMVMVAVYALAPGFVLIPYGPGFAGARPYLGLFAVALTLLALANLLINYFLSIARNSFVGPLFAVCVLETALIAFSHTGILQIVTMVVLSLGSLCAIMGGLYLLDRYRIRWKLA